MSVINKHAEMRDLAQKNLRASVAFLAENNIKPSITTLASGLQYRMLHAGDGQQPDDDSTVICHYKGQLIDERIFGASDPKEGPVSFVVKELIPGLKEGLKLMKVGGIADFFIPPDLAYGDRPASSTIGPNVVLIYRIELLKIK